MSKKLKKGVTKPANIDTSGTANAEVSANKVQPEPSAGKERAKKTKNKHEPGTAAKDKPAGKKPVKKADTPPKASAQSSQTDGRKDSPHADSPKPNPSKPGRAKADALVSKGAKGKPRVANTAARSESSETPVTTSEQATKKSASKKFKADANDAGKSAKKKDLKGAKSKAKGASKVALSDSDAGKPASKAKRGGALVDEDKRGLRNNGEELTFANSPFADSPHVDETADDAVAEHEQAAEPKISGKKAAKTKKAPSGKRSKGAAQTATVDHGAEAEKAATSDAAEHLDEDGLDEDSAAADETLIDPAGLAPEGELDADEEDAEEPSLFTAEAQTDDEEREVLSEEEENRRYLKGILEALLFSSDKPLSGRELARAARIDKKRTMQLLLELRKEYRYRGVNIAEISGGFVLRSNPTYGAYVQKALALRPVRLSRAQLETLAIIAYRQPITRPEIDDIRGVDSGQVLKGLADRDLIKMLGKKDEAGRPMLYGTTDAFLELFSLESLKGLPSLREFTELSDDSKEKFAQVTGETMPGGDAEVDSEVLPAEGGEVEGEEEIDGVAEVAEQSVGNEDAVPASQTSQGDDVDTAGPSADGERGGARDVDQSAEDDEASEEGNRDPGSEQSDYDDESSDPVAAVEAPLLTDEEAEPTDPEDDDANIF